MVGSTRIKSGAWSGSKEEETYPFLATASCSIGPAAYGSMNCMHMGTLDDTLWSKLHLGSGGRGETMSHTWAGHWCTMQNSRHGCVAKAPLKQTGVVHLVLKVSEHMGNSGENYHIRNYQLQREISSIKLSCFHLARALECKFSGAAYYMHIAPSKTNLKHLNTTLMMDYFQGGYSFQNSLNIHQHCCRLVTCSTANLQ